MTKNERQISADKAARNMGYYTRNMLRKSLGLGLNKFLDLMKQADVSPCGQLKATSSGHAGKPFDLFSKEALSRLKELSKPPAKPKRKWQFVPKK